MKHIKLDIRDGELRGFKSHDTIRDITCPECGEYMDPDKPCPRCAAQVITLSTGEQRHPVFLRVKNERNGDTFLPLKHLDSFHIEQAMASGADIVEFRVACPPRRFVDYHPVIDPISLDKLFSGSVSFTAKIDPTAIATMFDPNEKD